LRCGAPAGGAAGGGAFGSRCGRKCHPLASASHRDTRRTEAIRRDPAAGAGRLGPMPRPGRCGSAIPARSRHRQLDVACGRFYSRPRPPQALTVDASFMKHFLKETDFRPHEVAEVFALAADLKRKRGRHTPPVLAQQTWALIFSKSSTRTRVSFEVGIHELGGNPLFLNRNDIQLGRGETIEDTARVLSRFVHGLVVRTFDHSDVERLASAGSV